MEKINKTFQFKCEKDNQLYTINGIITSFDKESLDNIKNVKIEDCTYSIFNISLSSYPSINNEVFNTISIYILGYKDREGQLGCNQNNQFIEYNEENRLINLISVRILEVLMLNGNTGHFIDNVVYNL